MYIQNASPDGPVAWLLAETPDRQLRWSEDPQLLYNKSFLSTQSLSHIMWSGGGGGALSLCHVMWSEDPQLLYDKSFLYVCVGGALSLSHVVWSVGGH